MVLLYQSQDAIFEAEQNHLLQAVPQEELAGVLVHAGEEYRLEVMRGMGEDASRVGLAGGL